MLQIKTKCKHSIFVQRIFCEKNKIFHQKSLTGKDHTKCNRKHLYLNMEKQENVKQTSAVTFDIILDENAVKPEPKRLALLKQNRKEPLTADEIEKRQKLAEDRRQARLAARLKRMHEREESTRKLPCSVDILQQQQSLRTGKVANPNEVSMMSRREILKTANDIVKGFNEMRLQLLNMDLKVDEGRCQMSHLPETKWQKALKSSKTTKNTQRGTTKKPAEIPVKNKPSSNFSSEAHGQKHEGVAFEIPFDDVGGSKKCKKKPAIASLQKKDLKAENQMVALKLEEKQRKAAKRRLRRQDARIRKTRESRESLMALRTKVNIFQQHQAAFDGQADPRMMLSEHEAACLAQDIADGFSSIHSKYKTDLERAEGFMMVYDKTPM